MSAHPAGWPSAVGGGASRPRLRLIGIGPGHPDQVTAEAVEVLRSCDVFLVSDKRSVKGYEDELVLARKAILERHGVTGRVIEVLDPPRDRASEKYGEAVKDWHAARAGQYAKAIEGLPKNATIGLLVWGDPSLYDATIRIAEQLGIEFDVVPGVSSVQLLAARHQLVLNRVGAPVVITTGRRLVQDAAQASDVVVMLDGGLSCEALNGDEWDIYWGVNLGTPDEALVSGRLSAVLPEIGEARAKARAASGWAMDIYLLRRVAEPQRTLVIGGARSGKSAYAERLLRDEATTYVATSEHRADDPEWVERIREHAERRPSHWATIETDDLVGVLAESGGPVLIDCLTLWLTRKLDQHEAWTDWEGAAARVRSEIDALLDALRDTSRRIVLVTNEVGQGVVPDTESGRQFRDLMGRANQQFAEACDRVVWCVAGRTVEMPVNLGD